jgi:hypothetical protein
MVFANVLFGRVCILNPSCFLLIISQPPEYLLVQYGCGKPFPASAAILTLLQRAASLSESSPCSYSPSWPPFSHVMPGDTALSFASIISPIEFLSPPIISAFSPPSANPIHVSVTLVHTLQFALEFCLLCYTAWSFISFPVGSLISFCYSKFYIIIYLTVF